MRCFQIIGLLSICFASTQAQKHIPSPLEILTFIEASPLNYEFEQWYGQFERSKKSYIPFGARINLSQNGLVPIVFDSILSDGIEERTWANESLQMEKPAFDRIQQIYQSQIESHPNFGFLYTLLGTCFVERGDYKKAIPYLIAAIEKDNYDAMAHWQLNRCYLATNRTEEALIHIIQAHLLNRNHRGIKTALKNTLKATGSSFDDSWQFEPVCEIQQKKDTIIIRSNGMWLSYGMYKAVWLYEPDYEYIRQSMSTIDGYVQSELEACIGTYMTYINMKSDDQRKMISMEKVGECIENETLESFILYEKVLVDKPSIIYVLNQEVIKKLIDYLFKTRIQ